MIKNAPYSCEKWIWKLEMYAMLHQKWIQILDEYNKLVQPAKQVQDLINGIDWSKGMMAAALATLLAIIGEIFE